MSHSSASSASSSSSDVESDSHSRGTKRKQKDIEQEDTTGSGDSDSDDSGDLDEASDLPVLSHAEKRRQKRKQQKTAAESEDEAGPAKKKKAVDNTAELAPSKVTKRQNSVWVGNLAFKTTPDALRNFFDGVGEITRVHMPMKLASGGPSGPGARKENRGFAYVDFATPDAKTLAITLSEKPLDGRRLLIKDGDDFNGRPAPSTAAGADGEAAAGVSKANLSGHTKTAQKILSAQKQPAGPTLFIGNLGFEATEQSIRELFDSHRAKAPAGTEEGNGAEGRDPWIRKVRLGTFEDTGKCKGWAFVDFTNTEHATSALINTKNHFLDGRKLVVEYASPDAVRRGGGPGHTRDKKPRGEKDGAKEQRPRRRVEDDSETSFKRKPKQEPARTDTEGDEQVQDTPAKRRRVDDDSGTAGRGVKGGKNPRARAKPGAALALAKRETAAIVPAQGKKIVF